MATVMVMCRSLLVPETRSSQPDNSLRNSYLFTRRVTSYRPRHGLTTDIIINLVPANRFGFPFKTPGTDKL
ncbi:hypothetical protein GX48_01070 [Paracoccidioides brasiliensis]|nr:hypothetical protein GX48_01070 [Paracoccidioides brasiliensis]